MAHQQVNKHPIEAVVVPSVVGYELNSKQYVISNYLIPALGGCILYILHFTCDFAAAYMHIRDDNPVWGALTIFFMYLPIIGCYVLTVSSWELWPIFEGCGGSNIKWFTVKTLQHICFPAWSMWRYAERIFWSIEGIRTEDEDEREKIINILTAPRTIELYYFLQGYLQAAPQILLQLHILMRHVQNMGKDTVEAQALSIVMSLAQMAKITTLFQRFKSQKLGGKCYPWFKPYKWATDCVDRAVIKKPGIVYRCKPANPKKKNQRDSQLQSIISDYQESPAQRESTEQAVTLRHDSPNLDLQSSRGMERRRSSDFYEQPTNSYLERLRLEEEEEKAKNELGRETSVVDGPQRLILRDDITETDFFNPKRLLEIKGMPEDDVVGKGVSILWWFCFLFARMLAISSFGYFYSGEIIWLLSGHFILVVALLLYDVRADEVRRAKAIFFIFIGFVYLFCLIEFKIRFKKVKFIYNGFFLLMFGENFVMVFIWWFRDIEDILNDWWYKYIFYVIIACSILSMLSMLFYVVLLKPKKVVVDVVAQ